MTETATVETATEAPPEGRIIVYFRPELPAGSEDWLHAP